MIDIPKINKKKMEKRTCVCGHTYDGDVRERCPKCLRKPKGWKNNFFLRCYKCGYEWWARVPEPSHCSHCHSSLSWGKDRNQLGGREIVTHNVPSLDIIMGFTSDYPDRKGKRLWGPMK